MSVHSLLKFAEKMERKLAQLATVQVDPNLSAQVKARLVALLGADAAKLQFTELNKTSDGSMVSFTYKIDPQTKASLKLPPSARSLVNLVTSVVKEVAGVSQVANAVEMF